MNTTRAVMQPTPSLPAPAPSPSPALRTPAMMLTAVFAMLPAHPHANAGGCDVQIFGDDVAYDVGIGPRTVAIGDLDGDGAADLAVANFVDSTVSVLLNQCEITASCPGDLNGDEVVDGADLGLLLSAFGPCAP